MRDNNQNRSNTPKAVALPDVEKAPNEDVAVANESAVKVPGAFSGTVNTSDFPAKTNAPAAEKVEAPAPEVVNDPVGIVVGCASLNVREKPDKLAGIVTAIPAGSEVMIDRKDSTADFYKVCNAAGIEGFCMKQYIEIRS